MAASRREKIGYGGAICATPNFGASFLTIDGGRGLA